MTVVSKVARGRCTLVAIGASAGGPGALATVLGGLPADYSGAIVLLQHVDAQFATGMATWLDGKVKLPVQIAKEGDSLVAGTIVLAVGSNVHLELTRGSVLHYVDADPLTESHAYAPSIDVFFASVAAHWRGPAVGVLLTGMGRDGAQGLRAMRDAGAITIAQDRASSVVYGMPKAAAELAAASEILPITQIGARLVQMAQHPPRPMRGSVHD